MPAPVCRAAAVLLVLCAAGCSTPGRAVTTEPPAGTPRRSLAAAAERARPAYRALDRTTECVGRVIYPVALVAAFPAYFLAGGGGASAP